MSLGWKLFLSYMVIVIVGASILIVTTLSIAPISFDQHMQSMESMMPSRMSMMRELEDQLNEGFYTAMLSSLLIATAAAATTALLVSVYVSYRIVQPIRALVKASQYIAAGNYNKRLAFASSDELGMLTESFNRMAASLEEIEATRQRLIGDVSHELKTPLASIQAYMEGLQDGIIEPTLETFQQIHHETSRLQRLVRDLQELSMVESGEISLNFDIYNLIDLLRSTVVWIQPQFEDKHVKLYTEFSDEKIFVRVDYDRLRQVLLNILGNALQYTDGGGQVTVRCYQHGKLARVEVQDTGVGLSEEDLERIFERFYRVDKSRARSSGGSGIGLTIARHILLAHGSDIRVESEGVGKGSLFYFDLPTV